MSPLKLVARLGNFFGSPASYEVLGFAACIAGAATGSILGDYLIEQRQVSVPNLQIERLDANKFKVTLLDKNQSKVIETSLQIDRLDAKVNKLMNKVSLLEKKLDKYQ